MSYAVVGSVLEGAGSEDEAARAVSATYIWQVHSVIREKPKLINKDQATYMGQGHSVIREKLQLNSKGWGHQDNRLILAGIGFLLNGLRAACSGVRMCSRKNLVLLAHVWSACHNT